MVRSTYAELCAGRLAEQNHKPKVHPLKPKPVTWLEYERGKNENMYETTTSSIGTGVRKDAFGRTCARPAFGQRCNTTRCIQHGIHRAATMQRAARHVAYNMGYTVQRPCSVQHDARGVVWLWSCSARSRPSAADGESPRGLPSLWWQKLLKL